MSPLDSTHFPDAPFPASYASEFRVHFDPEVYRQIQEHVRTDTSHEVGGILVGLWKKDENGPYAAITAMIRCDKAVGKEGEVTFTHETWNDIAREMDGPYVDFQIVGWYHSHPGFGVFLSERDLFIQEHFFSNPGQVALVVDPISETEGVFFWKDGKITPGEHFWVGQKMNLSRSDDVDAARHPKQKLDRGVVAVGRNEAGESLSAPAQPVFGSSWFSFLVILTVCLAMFVLGGLLAPSDGLDYRQRLLQGALYDYCFAHGKRPGLENYVFRISKDLHKAKVQADKLLDDDTEKNDTEKDDAKKDEDKAVKTKSLDPVTAKRLAKLSGHLTNAEEQLQEVYSTYCLSEKEKLAVIKLIGLNLQSTIKTKPKPKENKKQPAPKKPVEKKPIPKETENR